MLTDGLIGQVVASRYRVDRKIARGGMGAIYEVTHATLGRKFAMKTLAPDLSDSVEALGRFRREADIVATLRHPNIVEVIDWVEHDGMPALIMELLKGEDLKTRLRRPRRLSWNFIARVADPILSALAVAHKAGVVHRDLKPENIFLARDDSGEVRPKLLDFGVSKMWAAEAFQTTGARLIGTPAYMSPEQARGETDSIGPAADVWAMGAIMFLMATKKHAFEAPNVPVLLNRITYGDPERVRTLRPNAPEAFENLLLRAMSRDESVRITDMAELRSGLRESLESVAPGAFPEPLLDEPGFDTTMPPTLSGIDTPGLTDLDDDKQPTTLSSGVGQSVARREARSHLRTMLIGGVLVAAFAAVLVVALTLPNRDSAPHASTPSERSGAAAGQGEAAADGPGRAADNPGRATTAPEPGSATVAATPVAKPLETTILELNSRPAGAKVVLDGEVIGHTPLEHEIPRSDATLHVELVKDGYSTNEFDITADKHQSIERALEKRSRHSSSRSIHASRRTSKPKPATAKRAEKKPDKKPDKKADKKADKPFDPDDLATPDSFERRQ